MNFDKIFGCLIGGAIGDALGASVEFSALSKLEPAGDPELAATFPPDHVGLGKVTGATQLTLFTVEGLIRTQLRALERGVVNPPGVLHHAYLRWLFTQGDQHAIFDGRAPDGILVKDERLFALRSPNSTCRAALQDTKRFGHLANNNGEDSGSLVRSAPFGFLPGMSGAQVFQLAAECSRLTHGNLNAANGSGALALIILNLLEGSELRNAINNTIAILDLEAPESQTSQALKAAIDVFEGSLAVTQLEMLGSGGEATECLAFAIATALNFEYEPEKALMMAVNYPGKSNSTAAICGNILGARHGYLVFPKPWRESVELADLIKKIGRDYCSAFQNSQWFGEFANFNDEQEQGEANRLSDDYPSW